MLFYLSSIVAFTMSVRAAIANELHKQARKNFPTRRVEVKGINDLYQGDLVEMQPYSRLNNGYRYIMTVINCFSKFAFAVPLKSKSAADVANALRPILEKHKIKHFQTDQGTDWFNSKVAALFKKHNINHYYTYSGKKATIIERFNRTLKTKMWKVFTEQGNHSWLNILPDLVKKYNNTLHRIIGMKPNEVNKSNESEVLQNIVKNNSRKVTVKPKYSVGDRVRVSRVQKTFNKGYWPQWSNEIFFIHKVQPTRPVTYILKDEKGEVIKGAFYQEELSKTRIDNVFLVEKVIRRKGNKLLVRWLGYDKTFDSWIDKEKLVR